MKTEETISIENNLTNLLQFIGILLFFGFFNFEWALLFELKVFKYHKHESGSNATIFPLENIWF